MGMRILSILLFLSFISCENITKENEIMSLVNIDKKPFAKFFCQNPIRRRTEVFHQITDILVHISSKNISSLFNMHEPTDETHG